MIKIRALFVVAGLLWSSAGFCDGTLGLGIILGGPTGLSAKYNLGAKNAVDFALAFGDGRNSYLHSTWLLHREKLFELERHPVGWYYGIGGRVIQHDHRHDEYAFAHGHSSGSRHTDTHVAARAPIGLRLWFKDPSIEIFGELSLALDITPRTDVDLGAGLGLRYFF